ncbi:MAG: hypothetical protein IT534_03205 [Bauldia sp.]|nr:hypothetical protein [Bauldia sp.]
MAAVLAGCATPPADIAPSYVSPTAYMSLTCAQLREEATRVASAAAQAVGRQEDNVTGDAVAMGVGLVLFWPALFFIGGDGQNEAEIARLRGEMQAIEQVSLQKSCGITFQTTPPAA